jgi:hypothetical protein
VLLLLLEWYIAAAGEIRYGYLCFDKDMV